MANLKKIIQILSENQIDFVIVGGFGAMLHGSSQVTQDIDICVSFNESLITRLRTALKDYHPVHRMTPNKLSFLEYPADTKSIKNLYLQTDLGMVDLLGLVGGVGELDVLKKNALEIELNGKKCRVISVEDLIKAKKFMGRPKDVVTVKELECILWQEKP